MAQWARIAQQIRAARQAQRVRVLGVDGTGSRIGEQGSGVVVAGDPGRGMPVAVADVDERDPQAMIAWLAPLDTQLGVEVIVTDDPGSYRRVADELGV